MNELPAAGVRNVPHAVRRAHLAIVPALLLALSGCEAPGAGSAPQTVAAPAQSLHPVTAFAAESAPGAVGQVVLPETGQMAHLRLVRAYAAASGRECREVLVRSSGQERTRLFCHDGQTWIEARPLVSGAAARP